MRVPGGKRKGCNYVKITMDARLIERKDGKLTRVWTPARGWCTPDEDGITELSEFITIAISRKAAEALTGVTRPQSGGAA